MRKLFIVQPVVIGVLCIFALSLPFPAVAETSRLRPDDTQERITARLEALLGQLCERIGVAIERGLPISLPAFCTPVPPPPPPPPVDVCPNVPGTQESGPCADVQCLEEGGTWNGESCDMPPPPPVDVCPNVPGTQESGPCADAQCVADGGTWNGDSCDIPMIGHVVISEVHYDVDDAHGGVNTGNGNNEWVELYNGSAETVNLSGWKLVDNTATSTLPEGTLLPAGEFLFITATSSTAGFWPDIPEGVEVIVLGNQIGNGLAASASGDVLFLLNTEDETIDAVSWGENTEAFDPPVPDVVKGHSIARDSLIVDTDTVADWEDREIPSPGLADVPLPN